MLKRNDILIGIIVIVLVFFLFFIFINHLKDSDILNKNDIYARVNVSDKPGFELNGSSLVFGVLNPGSSSTKDLILTNNYNRDIKMEFYFSGDIKEFLTVSENPVLLKEGENKTIEFFAIIPLNASYGFYDGNVSVITRDFNNVHKK